MLFYLTLFLAFLYLKIYRVKRLHILTTISEKVMAYTALAFFAAMLFFNFFSLTWIILIIASFMFFIASALMVSAVQLGMFKDGKPWLVMAQVYRLMLPISIFIISSSIYSIFL